jgi:hypothetical protein
MTNHTDQLIYERWRLNIKMNSSNSLWYQVIYKLGLDHSESTRHRLYKLWRMNRDDIHNLVKKRTFVINDDD